MAPISSVSPSSASSSSSASTATQKKDKTTPAAGPKPQDAPGPTGSTGSTSTSTSGGSLGDKIHSVISHIATSVNGDSGSSNGNGPTNGNGPSNGTPQSAGGILEFEAGDGNGNADQGGHSVAVNNVLKSGTKGDNPNIDTQFFDNSKGNAKLTALDTQYQNGQINSTQLLDGAIDVQSGDSINTVTDKVNALANDPNNKNRVVNISAGQDRQLIYGNTARIAADDPKVAKVLGVDPTTVDPLSSKGDGSANPNFDPAAYQKVVDYVDHRLDAPDSAYNKSLQQYQTATKNAADKGITVVVSADNEQTDVTNLTQQGVKFQKGSAFNFYAMSNNVISVGAANDDHNAQFGGQNPVANFSSEGNGTFNPTVTANGTDVASTNSSTENAGTSFSSPEVAATVHDMLVKNPNLTFAQIKQLLQQGATDTSAPPELEGAGEITDPSKIINSVPPASGGTSQSILPPRTLVA